MLDSNHLSETVAGVGADWLEKVGYPADYSLESLDRLDELVAEYGPGWGPIWDEPLDGPKFRRHKPLIKRLYALGCYIGEALRRQYGGAWFLPQSGEPKTVMFATLEFPNGAQVDPVWALTQRLRHGWSVASFVRAAAAFAEGRVEGGECGGAAT